MYETIRLPKYLLDHKDEILKLLNSEKGTDYKAETWLQGFEDSVIATIVAEDLAEIKKRCPNRITRGNIKDMVRETIFGGYPEIRRLFLAFMIWGWGNQGRGVKNTKRSLSHPRVKEVLEESLRRIKNGQIIQAYEEFNLPGCEPAFFTKFFYFIGLGYEIRPLPVILDKDVAKFLEFLSTQEDWHLQEFAKVDRDREGEISGIKPYAEGYIKYVRTMDDWARELSCRADYIEYFMYEEGRNLKGRGRKMGKDAGDLPKIEMYLPSQKMKQLEAVAKELGEEPATLAKIWIIERLWQLRGKQELPRVPPSPGVKTRKLPVDILHGEEPKTKPKKEIHVMVEEIANKVEFRGRPFSAEELYDAMEHEYGPINRDRIVLADYCANTKSGEKVTDEDGNVVKKYQILISLKRGNGIYARYDPRRHGKWALINDVPMRVY